MEEQGFCVFAGAAAAPELDASEELFWSFARHDAGIPDPREGN